MIQVRDVEFSYGKQEVLKGISFCMEKGEFVCVLGCQWVRKNNAAQKHPGFFNSSAWAGAALWKGYSPDG